MSRTRWAIGSDGNDGITVNGHKFGAGDEGAPMLVHLFTSSFVDMFDDVIDSVLTCLQEHGSARAH
jgi:hypothetical protein